VSLKTLTIGRPLTLQQERLLEGRAGLGRFAFHGPRVIGGEVAGRNTVFRMVSEDDAKPLVA
jgi:hypothetical protein